MLRLVALAAAASGAAQPKLSASFYNLWASQIDWTPAQWEEDLTYMKDIGIDWAFVTYTSCDDHATYTAYCWGGGTETNRTQALYRSSDPDYVQIGDDVLGTFLAAASKVGLRVLVGLQLIPFGNVTETGALYERLVADIYAGYGNETSFRGYYLTQEWSPGSAYEAEDVPRRAAELPSTRVEGTSLHSGLRTDRAQLPRADLGRGARARPLPGIRSWPFAVARRCINVGPVPECLVLGLRRLPRPLRPTRRERPERPAALGVGGLVEGGAAPRAAFHVALRAGPQRGAAVAGSVKALFPGGNAFA